MLKVCHTIVHNGKPLPVMDHDTVSPVTTKVPSKREAQAAFDIVQTYSDAEDGTVAEAIATLKRFLETR